MGKEFFRKIPFDALGPNAYIHRMVRNNPYKDSQEIVMAAVLLKGVATITSKGQTTLPKAVRQTLGVEAGDSICYEVEQDGRVVVTRAEENADPVVGAFLDFLERDMIAHPDRKSTRLTSSHSCAYRMTSSA